MDNSNNHKDKSQLVVKKIIRPRDPRDPRRVSQGLISTPPIASLKRKVSDNSTPSTSSNSDKPRSILRSQSSDSKQPHRISSERRSSCSKYEESINDDRFTILSKVSTKLQSSSSTSVSIGLLSNFFINYYRMHQELVMHAWYSAFLDLERTSEEMFNTHLQDKILTAFYCINDSFATCYELFDRMTIDFTVFGPSVFFYAGMIASKETIDRLRKILYIWTERKWFSDQFIRCFCNSLDEGKFFGKQLERDGSFNDALLWTLPEFTPYFNSRLEYINLHQKKFSDNALQRPVVYEQLNRVFEDLKQYFTADLNTLGRKISHINQLNEQVDMLQAELKTFCNEELMLRAVVMLVITFLRFLNKTVKATNQLLQEDATSKQ